MFKKIVFLLGISTLAIAQKGYRIEGKAIGLQPTSLVLVQYFNNDKISIDTAYSDIAGRFIFEDSYPLEAGVYRVMGIEKGFDIIIDKNQRFSIALDKKDVVGTIQFKNSVENTVMFDYQRSLRRRYAKVIQYRQQLSITDDNDPRWIARFGAFNEEVKQAVDSLLKKYPQMLTTRFLKSFQEPRQPVLPVLKLTAKDSAYLADYARMHYFDNVFLGDERMINTSTLPKRLDIFLKALPPLPKNELIKTFDFILEQTKSAPNLRQYMVTVIAQRIENTSSVELDGLYAHIVEKYVEGDAANWDASTLQKIKELRQIKAQVAIGKAFQNLAMTDTEGKLSPLYDLKNKFTILVVYDPDCSHCQESMPKIVDFKQNTKRDAAVYALSVQSALLPLSTFVDKYKTQNFINVRDVNGKTQFGAMGIFEYPTIFVLDNQKQIIARYIKPEQIEGVLAQFDK
jgi:thiol-disulfide isomerase/thioredoxin